jgi:hypothetical protein
MQEATPEMIERWKAIWAEFKPRLKPNRKPASDLITYLVSKYPVKEVADEKLKQVVIDNLLSNKCLAEKLPAGKHPVAVCFYIEDTGPGKLLYAGQDKIFSGLTIFVGVELETGFFLVEGSSELWDELFAYQGLDEKDLDNFYLVAEYIACLRKFHMLDNVLA